MQVVCRHSAFMAPAAAPFVTSSGSLHNVDWDPTETSFHMRLLPPSFEGAEAVPRSNEKQASQFRVYSNAFLDRRGAADLGTQTPAMQAERVGPSAPSQSRQRSATPPYPSSTPLLPRVVSGHTLVSGHKVGTLVPFQSDRGPANEYSGAYPASILKSEAEAAQGAVSSLWEKLDSHYTVVSGRQPEDNWPHPPKKRRYDDMAGGSIRNASHSQQELERPHSYSRYSSKSQRSSGMGNGCCASSLPSRQPHHHHQQNADKEPGSKHDATPAAGPHIRHEDKGHSLHQTILARRPQDIAHIQKQEPRGASPAPHWTLHPHQRHKHQPSMKREGSELGRQQLRKVIVHGAAALASDQADRSASPASPWNALAPTSGELTVNTSSSQHVYAPGRSSLVPQGYRPADEVSAGATGSDPAIFPPLPRPMQSRHGIKVQTGGSSGGGAATIRLNDLRVTSSQAPNPTPQLSRPRDQDGSPHDLAMLAEAVQDSVPVEKTEVEADEESDDQMAAETLIALVNMASVLPAGSRSGKGKQRKMAAGSQKQQKSSKKEAALSRADAGAHPVLGFLVPHQRRSCSSVVISKPSALAKPKLRAAKASPSRSRTPPKVKQQRVPAAMAPLPQHPMPPGSPTDSQATEDALPQQAPLLPDSDHTWSQ